MDKNFDIVVIGSGFGSLFFIHKILEKSPKTKIAVLEWGEIKEHAWQIDNQRNTDIPVSSAHTQNDDKEWRYTIGFGGGMNCWYGQTPRLLPADFEMKSRFGIQEDWPFSYDDLEKYYVEAEKIMSISGHSSMNKVYPRSAPFPLPSHIMSDIDKLMIKAQPNKHFPISTARASINLDDRPQCCASSRCWLCPIDAKFTALNGFKALINHPNITYIFNAQAWEILHKNNVATGVLYKTPEGKELQVKGELIVLGANAIQSPAILLRSDINSKYTGVGICEQYGHNFEILLDGIDNFGGSTITTGLNYSFYDGMDRSKFGAALLYFENYIKYGLRHEHGKWRQTLPIFIAVEDLPQDANKVTLTKDNQAFVAHTDVSIYAKAGFENVASNLHKTLSPLPIETIIDKGKRPTESHIQCSLRAGTDINNSVVDGHSIHHKIRNLVVVGSSTFTTCPPANPSLTVAATALRAADLIA